MQRSKSFNRVVCLSVALVALGVAGCAHHSERTASGYWNDKMTSRHVKSALDREPTYKYPDVTINTYDGIVSLGGFVNTDDQKKQAIDIARNVSGVREVIDNLVLKTEPTGRAPVIEGSTPKVYPQSSPNRDTNSVATTPENNK